MISKLVEQRVASILLDNCRRIWIRTPPEQRSPELQLILLDAEYYLRMPSFWNQIDRLESDGSIPPVRVVLISHLDDPTRRRENVCYTPFARFVVEELMSEIQVDNKVPLPTILGGLSLTGLSAAFTAISHPNRIDGVICQSPSCWWSNQKILDILTDSGPSSTVWRICVGTEEVEAPVDHGPGLIQLESQVSACRKFRDLLVRRGSLTSYEEYAGGHKLEDWERDFPTSLAEVVGLLGERSLRLDGH